MTRSKKPTGKKPVKPATKKQYLIARVSEADATPAAPKRPTILAQVAHDMKHIDAFLLQNGIVRASNKISVKALASGPRKYRVEAWLADECCTPPAKPPVIELEARNMTMNETLERLASFSKGSWAARAPRRSAERKAIGRSLAAAKKTLERARAKK